MTPELVEVAWLPHDALARARARLRESEAAARRARELADLDPRLDRWAEVLTRVYLNDETTLLRLVLASDPTHGGRHPESSEKYPRPLAGVAIGDEVLLAVPVPDLGDSPASPNDPDRMELVIAPRSAIRDIAGGLPVRVYAPDWA